MTAAFLYTCAFFVGMNVVSVEAVNHTSVCYALDAILFLYGIILTVLYCRVKMTTASKREHSEKGDQGDGIYTGLTPHAQDTYETLNTQRK
ncbi:high affinity immunoglobulin epsilon receptor subunit gamma-like [Arapaima gigas]